MNAMPATMKLGMAAAFIGAIIAFASMAMIWDGDLDKAPLVGVALATTMCFFATAGCFTSYSPVKASTVVVLSAIAIAFALVAGIYGANSAIVTVVLVILGAICVFCGNLDTTKDYVEANRMV